MVKMQGVEWRTTEVCLKTTWSRNPMATQQAGRSGTSLLSSARKKQKGKCYCLFLCPFSRLGITRTWFGSVLDLSKLFVLHLFEGIGVAAAGRGTESRFSSGNSRESGIKKKGNVSVTWSVLTLCRAFSRARIVSLSNMSRAEFSSGRSVSFD